MNYRLFVLAFRICFIHRLDFCDLLSISVFLSFILFLSFFLMFSVFWDYFSVLFSVASAAFSCVSEPFISLVRAVFRPLGLRFINILLISVLFGLIKVILIPLGIEGQHLLRKSSVHEDKSFLDEKFPFSAIILFFLLYIILFFLLFFSLLGFVLVFPCT